MLRYFIFLAFTKNLYYGFTYEARISDHVDSDESAIANIDTFLGFSQLPRPLEKTDNSFLHPFEKTLHVAKKLASTLYYGENQQTRSNNKNKCGWIKKTLCFCCCGCCCRNDKEEEENEIPPTDRDSLFDTKAIDARTVDEQESKDDQTVVQTSSGETNSPTRRGQIEDHGQHDPSLHSSPSDDSDATNNHYVEKPDRESEMPSDTDSLNDNDGQEYTIRLNPAQKKEINRLVDQYVENEIKNKIEMLNKEETKNTEITPETIRQEWNAKKPEMYEKAKQEEEQKILEEISHVKISSNYLLKLSMACDLQKPKGQQFMYKYLHEICERSNEITDYILSEQVLQMLWNLLDGNTEENRKEVFEDEPTLKPPAKTPPLLQPKNQRPFPATEFPKLKQDILLMTQRVTELKNEKFKDTSNQNVL